MIEAVVDILGRVGGHQQVRFGVRIQAYGRTDGDTRWSCPRDETGFAGLYLDADRVVGAVAWNRARVSRVLRHRVTEALQKT